VEDVTVYKYHATAAALKLFSISPATRRAYRVLGNQLGQRGRMRQGIATHYVQRAKTILERCTTLDTLHPGDRILEIGTGWVHWEAMVIRLVHDVEITLFDVWDNRQLRAFKHYCQALDSIVDEELGLNAFEAKRAHEVLRIVAQAGSFDDVYSALGFRYIVNPQGTLTHFPDQTFAMVFSANVMEHVDRGILPDLIRDMYRIMLPGGYSIQWIDLGDHLAYYDQSACVKNYLAYSDRQWRRFFENSVQYINRVQRPKWLEMFEQAGFTLVTEETSPADISQVKVNPAYAHLSAEDLQCHTLQLIHRRPI
jgi:Methyltransferase domain